MIINKKFKHKTIIFNSKCLVNKKNKIKINKILNNFKKKLNN